MNEALITTIKKIKIRYVIIAIATVPLLYFVLNYSLLYVAVSTPSNLPKVTDFNKIDHLHTHNHTSAEESPATGAEVDYRKNIIKDSYKKDAEIEVSVTYGEEGMNTIGKPGLHVVKRQATAVTANAGNTTASSAFSVPWYGFLYKNIDIKLDTNAEKIAYKSSLRNPCGVYSEELRRAVQYDCNNPKVLSVYETPDTGNWSIQNIAELRYQRSAFTQYKGGLIGVTEPGEKIGESTIHETAVIQVTSPEGTVSFYNQPDGVNCLQAICIQGDTSKVFNSLSRNYSPARIFTDTKDQTNSRFIFVTSEGAIYLGEPNGDSVTYKNIKPPQEYDPAKHQTLCDMHGTRATCYQGLSDNPPSGQVSSQQAPAHLLSFRFDSDEQTAVKLRDNLALNYLGVTSDNSVFVKERNTLIYIQMNGNKVKEIPVSNGVDKVSAGADLYYTYDKGVYKLENQTLNSYRVFHSDHIAPDKIITTNKSVIVLGRAPHNVRDITYAWKLNSEENLTPGLRIIDRLPSTPNSTAFSTTDLVGDKIYIQVPMDRSTPLSHIEETRDRVIRSLRESGIDTNRFQIVSPKI